jgi:hypothetical protein
MYIARLVKGRTVWLSMVAPSLYKIWSPQQLLLIHIRKE